LESFETLTSRKGAGDKPGNTMKIKMFGWLGLAVLVAAGAALLWSFYRTRPQVQPSYRSDSKLSALPAPAALSHAPLKAPVAQVPDSIRPVWGLNGETFSMRLQAVKALGNQLSRAEIEALYAFLSSSTGRDCSLKNEVIHKLRQQLPPPADLLAVLRQFHRDPQQDIVIRDYALQHLVAEYQNNPAQVVSNRISDILWADLTETNNSIAGTALLGLHRLCGLEQSIDSNQVNTAALELALNSSVGELARITPLQVCAQRQLKGAIPAAKALANEGASLALRISVIAAVGGLGGPDEKQFLELLAAEGNKHLQPAIKSALKRLEQRLAAPKSSFGATQQKG
jgi:hypothetical protein